jgi:hypothetical protein
MAIGEEQGDQAKGGSAEDLEDAGQSRASQLRDRCVDLGRSGAARGARIQHPESPRPDPEPPTEAHHAITTL